MEGEKVTPRRNFIACFLRQTKIAPEAFRDLRPDFLIISPPKTGSTWLAANLRCHARVFVPAVKEVKYFSSYGRWLDLEWYLSHFWEGRGRLKGEASPSYAILPVDRIRLVRNLLPDVKLIYLMRDPIARAWSHAKHNYRFREANFGAATSPLEDVPAHQWRDNFSHQWPLASGDYLGQLRRWLTVFPREQFYVGFYESIVHCPRRLLSEIFAFLGLSDEVDWAGFPLTTKILAGLPGELSPDLQRGLQRILAGRTRQLASFLQGQFDIEPPVEWGGSLNAGVFRAGGSMAEDSDAARHRAELVFRHELDDHYLDRLLEQEEGCVSAPRLVLSGYRGYHIFLWQGRCHALLQELCPRPEAAGEHELQRITQPPGNSVVAPSLAEVKEIVDRHALRQHNLQRRSTPSSRPLELGSSA